jgi:hypothetical protein
MSGKGDENVISIGHCALSGMSGDSSGLRFVGKLLLDNVALTLWVTENHSRIKHKYAFLFALSSSLSNSIDLVLLKVIKGGARRCEWSLAASGRCHPANKR